MRLSIEIAAEGVAEGESPFGAVVFNQSGRQIAAAHNRVRSTGEPSAHAVVLAINQACVAEGRLTLEGSWLVTTGEPCPMCAAIACLTRVGHVVIGARADSIKKAGYETLNLDASAFIGFTSATFALHGPILERECNALLLNHPKGES